MKPGAITEISDSAQKETVRISFWQRYVIKPLIGQLKQGAEPGKLAQSLSWGFMLGIFPILGTTTTLCGVAAIWLKLNHIAIQLVNWLVYPVQILMIIPFLKLGNYLFGVKTQQLSLADITAAFENNFWSGLQDLGGLALRGIAAWTVVALPVVFLLTRILKPVMIHLNQRISRKGTE